MCIIEIDPDMRMIRQRCFLKNCDSYVQEIKDKMRILQKAETDKKEIR